MTWIATLALTLTGVVHLAPAIGVLGAAPLRELYGTRELTPDLEVLLRHRAVLFALFSVFLFCCAYEPRLHLAGVLAGLLGAGSFVLLAHPAPNARFRRVVIADIACVLMLAVAGVSLINGTDGR